MNEEQLNITQEEIAQVAELRRTVGPIVFAAAAILNSGCDNMDTVHGWVMHAVLNDRPPAYVAAVQLFHILADTDEIDEEEHRAIFMGMVKRQCKVLGLELPYWWERKKAQLSRDYGQNL